MKIALLLLLSLFLLPITSEAVDTPDITINLVNTDPDPVRAGENFELRFKVENTGSGPFYNTVVVLDVESPFSIVGERQKSIGTIGSQQGGNEGIIVRYTVNVADNAREGVYDFDVAYFERGKEGARTIQTVESIVVDERNEPSYLLTPEEGSEGNNLVIGVTNTGKDNLSFVSITIQASEEYDILKSPIGYIGNLESDDFDSASFNIALTSEDEREGLVIPVTIAFTDEYDNQIERQEQVDVPIALIATASTTTQNNALRTFISVGVGILVLIFAIFMLADNFRSKKTTFKKTLWTIIILTLIGTPIYYFVARNRA